MAFGNVNLGNLSSVLSMTGGDPTLAERFQTETPPPAAPPLQQSVIPDNANDVLAATGSQYRVPSAPAAAPALTDDELLNASQPAAPASVDRTVAPVSRNATLPQLNKSMEDTTNRQIELKTEGGDIDSAGAKQQAQLYRDEQVEGREGIDQMKERRQAALARKDQNTEKAYASLQSMQDQLGNPPDTSKGKVLQIIGAILGGTKGGAGIGRGLQMIGQMQGGDVEAWARGVEGSDKITKALTAMNAAEDSGVDHELAQEHQLSTLVTANTLNALNAVAAETKSEETKRAAEELAVGVKAKYEQHRAEILTKQAAVAAKKKTSNAIYAAIAKGKTPQERAAIALSYGDDGEAVLKKIQGTDKAVADIENTAAGTEKTRAEAAAKAGEGGPQEILPGYFSSVPLDKPTITDINKNARATASIIADLGTLRAIRERNKGGTWDSSDMAVAEGILSRMPAKYSQMSGSGAPSESEKEEFKAITLNPTDFFARKNPTEIYDRTARELQNNLDAQLDIIGVAKRAPSTAPGVQHQTQEVASSTPGAAPVRMVTVNKDGKTHQIDSRFVDEAVNKRGFALGAAAAPAPAALASADDASYEEQVRREQGY